MADDKYSRNYIDIKATEEDLKVNDAEYSRITKTNISAMEQIVSRLADVNNDRKLWDKLATVSLADKGFNDFYHKDSN